MSGRAHRVDVVLLAVLGLAAALVAARFMDPGYPSAWDGAAHFVRLRALTEEFLPQGRTDGWVPWWFNGFAPFQFYPNLYFVALGILYWLLGGTVPLLTIFKLSVIATWALLPAAVWVLARAFRLSRPGATIAAVASLGLTAPQGIGIQGLFGIGLIPQGVGLLLFCMALTSVHAALTVGRRHVPRAALWCAAVVCTHLITGVYLALAAALYTVMALSRRRRRWRRTLERAATIGALTAAMSLATLSPLLVWPELLGPGTGWPDQAFLQDFLAGRFLSGPAVAWLALAFVVGLRGRRFESSFLVALALLTAPFAAGAVITGVAPVDAAATQLLRHRAMPYLGLLVAVFAGGAVDVVRRMPRAGALVAFALGGLVVWETQARVRDHAALIQVDAHHRTPEKTNFLRAYHWLRDHAAQPTLVGFDDRYDARFGFPGYTQIASRIVLEADRFTLLGNQVEATRAHNGEVLVHLHDWEPERILAAFRRYNVGYVLAWADEVAQNLARSPAFTPVFASGPVRVWSVAGVGGFATGPGVHVEAFALAPERVTWLLRNDGPRAVQVALAVAWHPNWQARIGGVPVPVTQTADHLTAVDVSRGLHLLTLTWIRPWWNRGLGLFSIAVAVVTAVWWWRLTRGGGVPPSRPASVANPS